MKGKAILRSLLLAYGVTGLFLLILAFLLFQFEFGGGTAAVGIIIIYVVSCLVGGFMAGKIIRDVYKRQPERSPTLEVSRSSRPRPRIFRSSWYSSRSWRVMPGRRRRDFPRRLARARFSSIPIVAAVPVIGSWNTRPRYAALLYSESFRCV